MCSLFCSSRVPKCCLALDAPVGATLGERVARLEDLGRDVFLQDGEETLPVQVWRFDGRDRLSRPMFGFEEEPVNRLALHLRIFTLMCCQHRAKAAGAKSKVAPALIS